MARRPASFYSEEKPVVALKDALKAFLKKSGLDGGMKHPQLDAAWRRIVGPEIVEHTRVLGFRKGKLEIGVDSSALMNDIRFHHAALLADLKREIPRPVLVGISFSLIAAQENDEGSAEP